jgi:pimeloyl-ACP methyl ester carboxylesterase
MIEPLSPDILPACVRARFVSDVNGLSMHLLEAGFEPPGRPCVLLLHGFPELAYSWRKIMPVLADAGYHVIAPDQRGYGRTTGWDSSYDGDLMSFHLLNLVRDMVGLLAALGLESVQAIVGHDFGASVAAWCTLLRPDLFRALTLMSAPFIGPPGLARGVDSDIHRALAALDRPRKHYQWYYGTREANGDMQYCRQGVHNFLRAYYHFKSGEWMGNRPEPLSGWLATELAHMPPYYIMDFDRDMAATVASEMPSHDAIAGCAWLTEQELRVYSREYIRIGFQGGLQWYRCRTQGIGSVLLQVFAGRTIDVRSMFIAGARDWGIYQTPGAIERMRNSACTAMRDYHLIEEAGHWVQQERPEAVAARLLTFLAG